MQTRGPRNTHLAAVTPSAVGGARKVFRHPLGRCQYLPRKILRSAARDRALDGRHSGDAILAVSICEYRIRISMVPGVASIWATCVRALGLDHVIARMNLGLVIQRQFDSDA